MRSPKILGPARQPFWLSWNRPHIFTNHLEITGLEVAEVSADNEHVARVAEREVRLVLETHAEIERPVFDGMLRKRSYFFLIELSIFLRSFAAIGVKGVSPSHTDLVFLLLGMRVLRHCVLDTRSGCRRTS